MINDIKCHVRVIKFSILEYYCSRINTQSHDVKYVSAIERLDIKFEEIISNEDCLQGSSTINGVGGF